MPPLMKLMQSRLWQLRCGNEIELAAGSRLVEGYRHPELDDGRITPGSDHAWHLLLYNSRVGDYPPGAAKLPRRAERPPTSRGQSTFKATIPLVVHRLPFPYSNPDLFRLFSGAKIRHREG